MSSGVPSPGLVSGSPGSSSKNLVEFPAGKMTLKENTVTPDKRKDLKSQTSGDVEDVNCEFQRVTQCTTGGCVYVLRFKAGSRRLQEPKTNREEEDCRKVNECLNNPPVPRCLGGGSGPKLSALGGENGMQSLLGNMSHNQLMQLFLHSP
uniref:Adhesion regulating molecule 1 n=1 Tax=Paramormyrops kingsleyae TaxID=1676925 RepID=A0A3B3Q3A1_9TELE